MLARSGRSLSSVTSEDTAFARTILPAVSRTFAPAIDILPEPLSGPVRLAYLLCRVADTIEDARWIQPRARIDFLRRFATLLAPESQPGFPVDAFAEEVSCALRWETPEVRLVAELTRLMRMLDSLDPPRRKVIERWTSELSLGMARFVAMEEGGRGGWTALPTCEDLAAYEYCVAGTVGFMLNELIHLHLSGSDDRPDPRMQSLAISFGLGLQGTNILQDLSVDRERGWSYLPEEIARRNGTTTVQLEEPAQREAAMAAVREMAWRAVGNLDDGLEYVLSLPRRHPRVRLFCFWPLLLALRTLTRVVATPTVLVRRVRISRSEVRELTRKAIWRCLANAALRAQYRRERAGFAKAVGGGPDDPAALAVLEEEGK